MAIHSTSDVLLRRLRGAVRGSEDAGSTDGQLLERFVRAHDAAALSALVRRHGPMVWGVCRRILHNHHDAEDAFQATFLVLVRKAASVIPRDQVANWLYGVARQTAHKARATAMRRGQRERQVTEMPEPAVGASAPPGDATYLLDEELSRLPAKYRTVLLLCDLEGKTRREAAREIGCPPGAVAGRLARARAMLAKRLSRRDLPASGGPPPALANGTASAALPPTLTAATIHCVHLAADGRTAGIVSPNAAALTQGVLKAMLCKQIKWTAAVLLTVVMACAGTSLILRGAAAEPPVRPHSDRSWEAPPIDIPPIDDPAIWQNVLRDEERIRAEDKKRMQGTWDVIYAENNGRSLDPIQFRSWRVDVSGARFVVWDDALAVPLMDTTFELQPGRAPKRIEFTYGKTHETVRGIYRFGEEGQHLYLVYNDDPKDTYPTQFLSGSESGKSPNNHLLILRRKAGPPAPEGGQDQRPNVGDVFNELAPKSTLKANMVIVKADAKARRLYAASGEGVLVDSDNGDIKIWHDTAQELNGLPVAGDAVLQIGGRDVGLDQFKTGTRVQLELASDGDRFVVVGVRRP